MPPKSHRLRIWMWYKTFACEQNFMTRKFRPETSKPILSNSGFCSALTCWKIYMDFKSNLKFHLGCSTNWTLIFPSSEKPELVSLKAAKSLISTEIMDKACLLLSVKHCAYQNLMYSLLSVCCPFKSCMCIHEELWIKNKIKLFVNVTTNLISCLKEIRLLFLVSDIYF